MTSRQVYFSDLTGEPIPAIDDIVTVMVVNHPALAGKAVRLEVGLDELAGLTDEQTTTLELWFFDGKQVTLSVNAAAFDALATLKPMAEILAGRERYGGIGKLGLSAERHAFRRQAMGRNLYARRGRVK